MFHRVFTIASHAKTRPQAKGPSNPSSFLDEISCELLGVEEFRRVKCVHKTGHRTCNTMASYAIDYRMKVKRIRIKKKEDFFGELERTASQLDRGKRAKRIKGEFFESLDAVRNVLTPKRL